MGPERILPHQGDELADAQEAGPGNWSNGEDDEEEAEPQSGYQYQPLNQEPEEAPPTQSDLHQRLQAMRLHLPDAPLDSDEEQEGGVASPSSIPMDPDHVELVKRTMVGVKLPSLAVPMWAEQLSDADWDRLVHQTIQSRAAATPTAKK
ncbi:male-enhanced antigen 1 [Gastrophryne carolinensis]